MSGFLDGVLKPGDGARMAVTRELEVRRKRWTRSDHHYRGVGDFLLQHGTFWNGRQIPAQYEPLTGPMASCYQNALEAAEADPTLRYVEGVYAVIGQDFHGHAWCLDADDQVVEVTVPTEPETVARMVTTNGTPYLPVERWGYFGAVINTAYVRAHRNALMEVNGLALFDLSPVEDARQRATHKRIIEGRPADENDLSYDDSEDEDMGFVNPTEWPILREPFDPHRTTL